MLYYLFKRLLLMIPTLLGVMLLNFIIIQAAPGGPIDYMISRMQSHKESDAGMASFQPTAPGGEKLQHLGWDDKMTQQLQKLYGFDKPFWARFWYMMKNYLTFHLGDSYFKSDSVAHLILSKIPVSISIGLWATLIIYLVSIPLGIAQAVYHGRAFDIWTSAIVIIGYAVPSFLFALALIILFAGGSFWPIFPLKGLVSFYWDSLSFWGKIKDYIWHMTLPTAAQVLSGFAALTLLTKNSFLEEIHKQYVMTARAQGFTEKAILMKSVFRNALLVIIAGLPAKLLLILFSSSLLVEMIFSLDGLGLLSYEAVMTRDYPVIFGSLYVFTLVGFALHLITDLVYTWIDPRIDFHKKVGG